MESLLSHLVALAACSWLIILLLPWLHGEVLEPHPYADCDLNALTVLIPARNEAGVIGATLRALAEQGGPLKIVLVDDGSEDGTAHMAQQVPGVDLAIVNSEPLPSAWNGKLWALEQGVREVDTPYTLLLDADILLKPGMAAALLTKARSQRLQFVSIMASLRMDSFWEKLLMPAFIYFFKLLYPFRLANSSNRYFAAAAGGCILLETRLIREMGGFAAIKSAIIDDCSLAKRIKQAGHKTWIGQSRSVVSLRRYERLEPIWEMVVRTAFTQLRYSNILLTLCTSLMLLMFWTPPLGLLYSDPAGFTLSLFACTGMAASYLPTLRLYGRNWGWALSMPVIAGFYLAMTWNSAQRYWRGERSRWKDRVYAASGQ